MGTARPNSTSLAPMRCHSAFELAWIAARGTSSGLSALGSSANVGSASLPATRSSAMSSARAEAATPLGGRPA
eukprot:602182-Pyramimonas_sp.AAC.1